MSSLTSKEVRGLMEAYQNVYAPQEITEEQVWEQVEEWVNGLLDEGYDLSDYTWEEMYEAYIEEQPMSAFDAGGGQAKLDQLNKGLSPRSSLRATRSSIESQGRQNLYKAGGGDAAMRASAQRRNARGGRSVMVPTLSRSDIEKRGAAAAAGSSKPSGGSGGGSGGSAVTPAAAGAKPAGAPAAAPAAGTKAAGPESIKPKTPNPLLAGGELARMRAASMMRQQGRNLPSGKVPTSADLAPKPAATTASSSPTPTANPFKGSAATTAVNAATKKPAPIAAHTDLFDLVKGYLLDEGYADTEEAALAIMTNMSEEWRENIIEADSIAAMRERAAKRRKQRYGASDTSKGGRDDFRPYTEDDYKRGERKKDD